MAGNVQIASDFIIGGHPDARVTPNFRLKELYRTNGKVRVHRELVAGLQILRDNLAASIAIDPRRPAAVERPSDDGLYLVIAAEDFDRLREEAMKLLRQG
ncbi:MAG: hypothetical protein AB2805_09715 [Candidatus Thiodiazotropha sp.]